MFPSLKRTSDRKWCCFWKNTTIAGGLPEMVKADNWDGAVHVCRFTDRPHPACALGAAYTASDVILLLQPDEILDVIFVLNWSLMVLNRFLSILKFKVTYCPPWSSHGAWVAHTGGCWKELAQGPPPQTHLRWWHLPSCPHVNVKR